MSAASQSVGSQPKLPGILRMRLGDMCCVRGGLILECLQGLTQASQHICLVPEQPQVLRKRSLDR